MYYDLNGPRLYVERVQSKRVRWNTTSNSTFLNVNPNLEDLRLFNYYFKLPWN